MVGHSMTYLRLYNARSKMMKPDSKGRSPIRTIHEGEKYLSTWNNKLSMLIDYIIGDNTEEALSEPSLEKRKSEIRKTEMCRRISTNMVKVANLSKKIIDLSDSIGVLIQKVNHNGEEVDKESHNWIIFEIDSGINTMRTVRRMISTPMFNDLKDTLIGLENNYEKFYNAYISALNTADPNRTLQRPDEAEKK
jgi:hypothetical protein